MNAPPNQHLLAGANRNSIQAQPSFSPLPVPPGAEAMRSAHYSSSSNSLMPHRSTSDGARYQEAPADLPSRPPQDNVLRSRSALLSGSPQFRSSSSMIDLPHNLKKIEAMSSSWQGLREARKKAVSTAHAQCMQLLREAQEAVTGAPSPEASMDEREDAASTASLDSNGREDVAGQRSSRGRNRGKTSYQCQLRRPNKPLSSLTAVKVHAGKVEFKWSQNFTNITRTLELSAMQVLGAELAGEGVLKLHTLTPPSSLSPEGNSDHEVYELFGFENGGTAEDCRAALQRMADTLRPFQGKGALWMVVNPVSGHRQGEAFYRRVKPLFEAAQVFFEREIKTTHAGHARAEILQARGAEWEACRGIVCIGGDGTVSEVLNAIMDRPDSKEVLKRVTIGTIPAGSECALAKMVSYINPVSAAWVILKGHKIKPIDVLKVTQEARKKVIYSICGCGWGLAGKLAEDSESMRATYGPARYLVSGLKSFVNLRGCPGTLKVLRPKPAVAKEVYKPCHFASICPVCDISARRASDAEPPQEEREEDWDVEHGEGGFVVVAMLKSEKALAPYVHLSDGYMDVLSIGKVGRLELLRRSSKILTSSHITPEQEFCHYWKAKSVKLRPHNPDDKINVDGEVLDGEEIRVDVVPSALKVFCAFDERAQRSSANAWGDLPDWRFSPPLG